MRVLQLTSDWKWTGPAEPMLRLALALRARGAETILGCPDPPEEGRRSLAGEARAAGLAPSLAVSLGRRARWVEDRDDARCLAAFLDLHAVELVHCWHTRDHLIALRAARSRRRHGATRIVRSYRNADRIPAWPWNRWLFGPGSDGLLCVSPETARRNTRLRGGRPIAGLFGAVDLARFRPEPGDSQVRASLGIPAESPVVGIVARVQPQRRFDLLLEAAGRLVQRLPQARLLIVGRGTRRAEVAEAPAVRMGLGDRVVFAGYRTRDYAEVLRVIDVFTFLVPGSDGTCRALLEAAACGIPAVTTRRGALPEIVKDGETGLLVDEDPDALATAWHALLTSFERRAAMGKAARRRAERRFAPEKLAADVAHFYRRVAERR